MNDNTICALLINDALDRAGVETDDIRNDYSGRGMYGDSCASITFNNYPEIAVFTFHLALVAEEQDTEDGTDWADRAASFVRCMRTDTMGLGVVAYFPRWHIA